MPNGHQILATGYEVSLLIVGTLDKIPRELADDSQMLNTLGHV
jgi:hypothetical protein